MYQPRRFSTNPRPRQPPGARCLLAVLVLGAVLVPGVPAPADAAVARLVRDIDLTRSPHLPPGCPLSPCPVPEPYYGSVISRLTPFGDQLVFSADDGLSGAEPWITDGTATGTRRLLDFAPGEDGSAPVPLGTVGSRFVLWVNGGDPTGDRWFLMSVSAGGEPPIELSLPCGDDCAPEAYYSSTPTVEAGGFLHTWVRDRNRDSHLLLRTDGFTTSIVHDLCPSGACSRSPSEMIAWDNDILYTEGAQEKLLWRLEEGSTTPVSLVPDCRFPAQLTIWQNQLILGAACRTPGGLFAPGLQLLTHPQSEAETLHSLLGGEITGVVPTDQGFFVEVNHGVSHETSRQFYYSDGTPEGTFPTLATFDFVRSAAPVGDRIALAARRTDSEQITLWSVDPTAVAVGQQLTANRVTTELYGFEGSVYFGADFPGYGAELGTSDGTAAGTKLLADIYPGPGSSRPTDGGANTSGFAAAGGHLYFAANHPDYDIELWTIPLGAQPDILCVSDGQSLCFHDRFRVWVHWTDHQGDQGFGQAVALEEDTGAFWFFERENLELLVKVLDACESQWQSYWVFAGGLTDVGVQLRVDDLLTGEQRNYPNPLGTQFQPIQDTAAFTQCNPP